MPKKKQTRESFEETSRKLGCDESPEAFERAFASVVRPAQPPMKVSKTGKAKPKVKSA